MIDDATPLLVAVIEDDTPTRIALGRLLLAAGFEPALFDSAEAYISTALPRPPACLVLDVSLGGMSGIDLQGHLRRSGSAAPIIITTAHREDAIRERAQREGCAAFLCKPIPPGTLLATIGSIASPPPRCTKGQ